jgi:hypothetical protein
LNKWRRTVWLWRIQWASKANTLKTSNCVKRLFN